MKILRQDGTPARTIEDARALLRMARASFAAVDAAYQEARTRRDVAMAQLDAAQLAYDRAVNDERGDAPAGSRWNP